MSQDINKRKTYAQNLRCIANQIQNTGITTIPKQNIPQNLLESAIPPFRDVLCGQTMSKDEDECNTYKGKEGLQRLMKSQGSLKPLEPGCGWMYSPADGINQGASGSIEFGASFPEKYPGAEWMTNLLTAAERIGITQKEGFATRTKDVTEEAWARCQSPLTRDCLLLRSRLENCSDNGALNTALLTSTEQPYDKSLRTNPAFMMYQRKTNSALDPRIIGTGNTDKETALKTFVDLYRNTTAEDVALRMAARDLCLKAGEFDTYSFCSEMKDTETVNEKNLYCFQQEFLRMGGTSMGSQYPATTQILRDSSGRPMTKAQIRDFFQQVFSRNDATLTIDKNISKQANSLELARSLENKGSETVWFDYITPNGVQIPIILKCDYITPASGNPFITFTRKEEVEKYSVPEDAFAFMSLFEYRPETSESIRFQVTSDDGFAIGFGQPAFSKFGVNRATVFADWRYQGPTQHTQGPGQEATTHTQPSPFPIASPEAKQRNILCTQFFQGEGWAVFDVNVSRNNGAFEKLNSIQSSFVQNMYVTQEPLAPWMRYEICPGGPLGQEGLYERRWGGPSAMSYQGQNIPSFDIQTNSNGLSDVGGVRCFPFTKPNDYWMTKARFAMTAFKSIAMKIRFRAATDMLVGEIREVFHHVNLEYLEKGVYCGIGLRMRKENERNMSFLISFSAPPDGVFGGEANTQVIPFGELQDGWYYLTLAYQHEGDSIRNASFTMDLIESLKPGSSSIQQYVAKQMKQGMRLRPFRSVTPSRRDHSGHLLLGGWNRAISSTKPIWMGSSFQGEVAWIHGFRETLSTADLVQKDISESWLTRLPK